MKRGQVPVLWVVIELVLVVVASSGIFLLVERAGQSKLPEQQYGSIEMAFTREALDIYARSHVYYELLVPGIPFNSDVSFSQGVVKVGAVESRYGFDANIGEIAYSEERPLIVQFEVAGGIVRGGEGRKESRKLLIPCPLRTDSGAIALIPTDEATQILTTKLIKQQNTRFVQGTETFEDSEKIKQEILDAAGAIIVLQSSVRPQTSIVEVNTEGRAIGCNLANSLAVRATVTTDPTMNLAVIPLSSFKQTEGPESYLADDKPGVIFTISNDLIENADQKLGNIG